MMEDDRNQTVANTVVDYRLSVQRDILLRPQGSARFLADFAVHPEFTKHPRRPYSTDL